MGLSDRNTYCVRLRPEIVAELDRTRGALTRSTLIEGFLQEGLDRMNGKGKTSIKGCAGASGVGK
jgi:hypothetical protein